MSRSGRNAKAEDYFRRAPNYCADAIPAIRRRAQAQRSVRPITSAMLDDLADTIERSHKFALPDGGMLFKDTSLQMLSDLRLPFPETVFEFEYSFHGRSLETADGVVVVDKVIDRMILCCFAS